MRVLLCLALIAACAFAFDIKAKQTAFLQTNNKLTAKMEEINKNEMGSLLMSLAEIHMATSGPLEDLLQALSDMAVQLQGAIDSENAAFEEATRIHENNVAKWESEINLANADIMATHKLLEDILYPRRTSLEETIAFLHSSIDSNIQTTLAETAEREANHADFLVKESEYTLAIEAADEALVLLNQLKNGEVSLLQTRALQSSLQKVQEKFAKIKNNKHVTLLKALAQIAQNFANQDVLNKVLALVTDLRNNCADGLTTLRANEEAAASEWANNRLPQLQNELASLQGSLAENEAALVSTNEEISANETFLSRRQLELAEFEAALDAENSYWDATVDLHNHTIEILTRDLEGTNAAHGILSSHEFSQYFHENVNRL